MSSLLLLKSMLLTKSLQKVAKKKKAKKREITNKVGNKGNARKVYNKCRICNYGKASIPILHNCHHPKLAEEIHNFSGVKILDTDKFSKYMCQNCMDLLNGCILFRDMCQKTDKSFKESYEIEVKIECKSLDEVKHERDHISDDSYHIPSPNFSDSEIWSCSTCMKHFDDLPSYNAHLPNCDNKEIKIGKPPPEEVSKKKFLCETCGKTTTSKASLLVHMSTHENNFPFKCDVCQYQGRTIDLLKVHKRSHLIDKPFKCTQCPKATTTSSNLAKHMRHVHSTARPFKCTYCDKMFSYQHDMKRHIRDIHLRQGTVDCDICYKKFNTKKILQGHRWKIHKIKSERSGRLPSYLLCQMEEQKA